MAEAPYQEVPNGSIISHLMLDERLPKPEECLEEMYVLLSSFIMEKCRKTVHSSVIVALVLLLFLFCV